MKTKFAHLLSAGGSFWGRGSRVRRMRLPQGKAWLVRTLTVPRGERNSRESATVRAESKVALLSQLLETMAREARGSDKARQS